MPDLDRVLRQMQQRGEITMHGDRVTLTTPIQFAREEDRLRFFIAGLATMSVNAPAGEHQGRWHAKRMREIRSAAKAMLGAGHAD